MFAGDDMGDCSGAGLGVSNWAVVVEASCGALVSFT